MASDIELFTDRLRKETRKIHSISDALVNAKFAISLRDETVWGGGLFVFYHIFAFLEDANKRIQFPPYQEIFKCKSIYRKKAFEDDLEHYLGKEWRSLPKSGALKNYLDHLEHLEHNNPKLLIVFVYHLYLGLLSGGQILAKKRRIFGEKTKNEEAYTDKVTDFSQADIIMAKNNIKAVMNEIASTLSDEEKQLFIDESNNVFLMNNTIINSVGGQDQVIRNLLYKASALVVVVLGVVLAFKLHK